MSQQQNVGTVQFFSTLNNIAKAVHTSLVNAPVTESRTGTQTAPVGFENVTDVPRVDQPAAQHTARVRLHTGPHLTSKSEYEAALALRNVHGIERVKNCGGTLYVYDNATGMWNHSEGAIYAQFCRLYTFRMRKWLAVNGQWRKLFKALKTITMPDNGFLKRMESTSVGKVLFRNGYYDFEQSQFFTEFSPKIFFSFRIERDYNPNPSQSDVDFINQVLFVDPFTDAKTGQSVKHKLARSFAGTGLGTLSCLIFFGPSNSGKSVLADALLACGGDYVGMFNSKVLTQCPGKGVAGVQSKNLFTKRFCRILIANGLDPASTLYEAKIQEIFSAMETRTLFGANETFAPHFTFIVNSNVKPCIVPLNETGNCKVVTIDMPFQFTTNHITPVLAATNFKPADAELRSKVREARYQDALFYILTKSYNLSTLEQAN